MTLVLEITNEQRKRLREKASKLGLDESGYLQRLIARETGDVIVTTSQETAGKALLDQWEAEGVLGLFSDRPDSPEYARDLREAGAQRV